jgi:hypothetical protein
MPAIAPLVGPADPFFTGIRSGGLELVPDTTQSPWKEVCRLVVSHPGGTELATGWILGFGAIVTAAHVFRGHRAATIQISPGAHRGLALFGNHTTTLFDVANDGSDCAAVFLRERLDGRLGAFAVNRFNAVSPQSILAVAGYDGVDAGRHQFRARGRQLTPQDIRIRYDVSTTGGQSGGPVWADANPVVVAIHNDLQLAVPITDSLINEMLVWRQHVPRVSVAVSMPVSMAAAARPITAFGITAEAFRPLAPLGSSAGTAGIGASVCETLGRSIGELAALHAPGDGPVTLIVDDDNASGSVSFRAQCVMAGVAGSMPSRLRCPQIAVAPRGIPTLGVPATAAAPLADIGAAATGDEQKLSAPSLLLKVRLADMPSGELVWCAMLLDEDGRVLTARTGGYSVPSEREAPVGSAASPRVPEGPTLSTEPRAALRAAIPVSVMEPVPDVSTNPAPAARRAGAPRRKRSRKPVTD